MRQRASALERHIQRNIRIVQCFVECGQQAAVQRRVVLKIREYAGRFRAPCLENQIGSNALGAAEVDSLRRVGHAEQAVPLHRGHLEPLQRPGLRNAKTKLQNRHAERSGFRRVASGAYQNKVFRIDHHGSTPLR